jgi:hypothetical protein
MKAGHALAMAKGVATYVPLAYSLFGQKRMMTAGITAKYCYEVWLKHALLVDEISQTGIPNVVAELGPGDTIGIGIAALLSGSSKYIGVDVRRFLDVDACAGIADELVILFRCRRPYPHNGWAEVRHLLDEQSYPSRLLTPSRLASALSDNRVELILSEVKGALAGSGSSMISYVAPMSDPSVIADNSIDLLTSQSVLEHVVNLRETLRNVFRWLKPGALTSHQLDLTSHNIVSGWDGHRSFSDGAWKLVVGKRPFMINRLPYSSIVSTFEECGFEILRADRMQMQPTVSRDEIARSWQESSDEDLQTFGGYVIARKPC